MPSPPPPPASRRYLVALVVALGWLVGCSWLEVNGDPQLTDVGVIGPSHAPAVAATGDKPQSKLWHHDGRWWAALYLESAGAVTVVELQRNGAWRTTGVTVDERIDAHVDVSWDGEFLHIMSVGRESGGLDSGVRYSRFTFDPVADSYSLIEGSPRVLTFSGVETIAMTVDSLGEVWATYADGSTVWVVHGSADGLEWSDPFALPVPQADSLTVDDIATIIAFEDEARGKSVGIVWGNQNTGTYSFAIHADGAPKDRWRSEIIIQGPKIADDHLNFKAAELDGEWWVAGVVKTSLTSPNDPLILLVVRNPQGQWTSTTFGTVADQHTRANLLIDRDHRQLYVFASSPCCSGGNIHVKTSGVDSPAFEGGRGRMLIGLKSDSALNNPTTTKQPVDRTTGFTVVASDVHQMIYAANTLSLADDDIPLDTMIKLRPPAATAFDSVTIGFSSTSNRVRFECQIDLDSFEPCASELTLTDLEPGPHSVAIRALDDEHPDVVDPTPAIVRWRQLASLLDESFGEGLDRWDVEVRGSAVAEVRIGIAPEDRSIAVFESAGVAGSRSHATRDLGPRSDLFVNATVRVTRPADLDAHVRLLTLTDDEGGPLVYVYRQTDATDDGRIWVRAGETRIRTSGTMPLDQWQRLSLGLTIERSGRADVVVFLDDEPILEGFTAELPAGSVSRLQIGYPTSGQSYSMEFDEIEVLN